MTLMAEMLCTVAAWMRNASFTFCGDGAYACLDGQLPKNVRLVSRIRRQLPATHY